jgi:uncharacterized OB-fold protein
MSENNYYLPANMPSPVPSPDGLDAPYWEGTRRTELLVQKCGACGNWQWGPEWLCHHCQSFDLVWQEVEGKGVIYSWERPWHPVHQALKGRGAYTVVLVELPGAGNVRMIGNLLGPDDQIVEIGAAVEAVFEAHDDADVPYTLVQWQLTG